MSTFSAHTFLVQPGKNLSTQPDISGRELTGDGELISLLGSIFHANTSSKDFEVTFRKSDDGSQQNVVRDLVIAHQQAQSLESAQAIAARLQETTDKRSGMGLLFVMTGQHATKFRTVLSRFPANEGILAEIQDDGLDVEFLNQVFIRQLSAYKAMLLEDTDPINSYWSGFATDRQAGGAPENISGYWLNEFLNADFSETPKAGTFRLAEALKDAARVTPVLSIKEEIASAVSLAPTALAGQPTSINHFCTHFGLSEHAKALIVSKLKKPSLANKLFNFDSSEFTKRVPYRSVELSNGAIIKAPSSQFNNVISVEPVEDGNLRYSTVGQVSDQKMTK